MTNAYTPEYFISFVSSPSPFLAFILVLVLWSIVWKALALWKSARRGEKIWFVFFLIVNTAGILEIIYLIINHESKPTGAINPIAPKDFNPPSNPNLS